MPSMEQVVSDWLHSNGYGRPSRVDGIDPWSDEDDFFLVVKYEDESGNAHALEVHGEGVEDLWVGLVSGHTH